MEKHQAGAPANRRPLEEPATKPVGIWIRVSTEDQVRGESPEHHERRARAYAEAKGWIVREVYRLDAVSGKSVIGHPEAERMLRDVASGRIAGLIFSKLARLARNTRELLDFADRFREHGADLVSLHESIDTSSPAGRLFYTMIAALAQWEREEIAERIAASVPVRARMGKSLGGPAPYGYRWNGHQLLINPDEAPVRKLIYELFLEHKRRRTVAQILNQRGYRTRHGVSWTDTTITRLLIDPSAKGIRRANYTRSRGEGRPYSFKPESEWVLLPIEPIVSVELWEQCNAILRDMREKRVPRLARRSPHLFTGILTCRCGQRMYIMSDSKKYRCPRCKMKASGEDLEAIFLEQLKGILISPDSIAEHLAEVDAGIAQRQERLAALEAEATRTRADMAKLFRLYTGDHISPAGFEERNRPLEERLRAILDEVPRLQGEVDFLRIQHLAKDELQAQGQSLQDRWPQLEFEEKRRIVEALVQRMSLGEEEIELTLGYFPIPSEIAAASPRKLHRLPPPRGGDRHDHGGLARLRKHRRGKRSLRGALGLPERGLDPLRFAEPLHGRRHAAGHRLRPDAGRGQRLRHRGQRDHVGSHQAALPLRAASDSPRMDWGRAGSFYVRTLAPATAMRYPI
jgi:site-specific DNA recombinase